MLFVVTDARKTCGKQRIQRVAMQRESTPSIAVQQAVGASLACDAAYEDAQGANPA